MKEYLIKFKNTVWQHLCRYGLAYCFAANAFLAAFEGNLHSLFGWLGGAFVINTFTSYEVITNRLEEAYLNTIKEQENTIRFQREVIDKSKLI